MKKIRVHNRRIDAWFIVDCGKVFDENTGIQLPESSREAIGALQYVEKRMNESKNKIEEIDNIQGELDLFRKYKYDLLRCRIALYGN